MSAESDPKPLLSCTSEEIEQLRELAASTTAGIWRSKRAKALLGVLQGISPAKLMYRVRVPVQSIVKCIERFSRLRMAYFDQPERLPTEREAAVERMLTLLDNPFPTASAAPDELTVRYLGCRFNAQQISLIRDMIRHDPNPSSAGIARQMCSTFNLRAPNGKPRVETANVILRRMAMDNLISIPDRGRGKCLTSKPPRNIVLPPPQEEEITSLKSLSLAYVLVQKPRELAVWNAIIHHYHYIPGCRLYGQQLRYLVLADNDASSDWLGLAGRPLAALSFSSAAWRVSCRDHFIGWNDEQRVANLPLVVNNSRFLILPWIRVPNLASRILGAMGRRVAEDWEGRYHLKPVLLESFVECDRFRGTCYKAANWQQVGTTVGYSLHGFEKRKSQAARAVYLRPLQKDFRDILCRL